MERSEAVLILNEIVGSLTRNPDQFVARVDVTGQRIESHGGTGLSVTATGGSAGSSTIGQHTVVEPHIGAARHEGSVLKRDKVLEAAEELKRIISQLEHPALDRNVISDILDSLGNLMEGSLVQPVVRAVLRCIF
jgi:hypothetical protein